jgi:redox-sensing transcriptional repressor
VRKDLSFFGVFGKQGVGYSTQNLREELRKILRLHQQVSVGLIGVGNLGTALIRYNVAREKRYPEGTGLKLVAAFDDDEKKVGRRISGVEVFSTNDLRKLVNSLKLSMIILTVPAEAAPEVLNNCIQAGVKAFLNFAPTKLIAPPDVRIHHADVTLELESLAYFR